MTTPWLTVIGIGDDGLAGLSPASRALIEAAELLVGGERHQAMVTSTSAERLTWVGGVKTAVDVIRRWRGRRVVVLATGDPMWFGGGGNLARYFGPEDMTVITHPGAFSLAAARMLWPLADVITVNIHSRPLAGFRLHIQPGARVLALARDGDTAAEVAALLRDRGFGPSRITVWEHLGGPAERRLDGHAEDWSHPRTADLNTLAIECRPGPTAQVIPPAPGLADELFSHDGQLTKAPVRAQTVALLRPMPGQTLWDVGAGAGSVAIEWLRLVPRYRLADHRMARAFAVERDAGRCQAITHNATTLGVPDLDVVHGAAPEALASLPTPDTIFVGGGITDARVLEACWEALASGGQLVANGVSLEANARLLAFRESHGGDLTRIAIARGEAVGRLTAFKPLMEVTQLSCCKP